MNTIQATEVAVDKKFKSFGSRLQEAARKVKDMEMRIEWQAAILPQNTEDCKALRNRIHDPGNQAQIKKCQVGRGSWKSQVRINWDCFPLTKVLGCGGGWYTCYCLLYKMLPYLNKPTKWKLFIYFLKTEFCACGSECCFWPVYSPTPLWHWAAWFTVNAGMENTGVKYTLLYPATPRVCCKTKHGVQCDISR